MRKTIAAAICAAVVAGLSAAGAFAGEVKGPPSSTTRTQEQVDAQRTAAPSHSNSICSYSGLNDMIPGQGPIDFHVQSPGQDVRNGGDPGLPGHGTCAGGSNPENPPTP